MRVLDSIKRCPLLSSTLISLALLAAVLSLGDASGHASEPPSERASYLPPLQAEPPETPPINPTGRVLEMIVPLNYRDFYLGDLSVRLTPQQTVEVPVADLARAVTELLRPEALSALTDAGGGAEYVSLAALQGRGFDFRFDPGSVSILFAPTLDQKVEGNISVQARKAPVESPNAADPAALAAFLNMRVATDYVGMSPAGREGLTAPRLDLQTAAQWQGVVVEAEATYEPDDASFFGQSGQGFKRRGTRLIRDFEADALRLSAGDIHAPGTSLQTTPDLLGVSIERSYAKLQPGRNIRPTSRRSFRIERPSSVDVEINGIVDQRLKLDPGDYNLSDLPVRNGVNDIVLIIEDDAGGRERLEFSVFRDGSLLSPEVSEWGLSAGLLSTFDQGEPDYGSGDYFASGYYRRGVTETLTAETHLQAGTAFGLGGVSLLYGSAAGLIALDGAASMQGDNQWGATLEANYSPPALTDSAGRDHAFRFAVKGRTEDFTASIPTSRPASDGTKALHDRWLDVSASYRTLLPLQVSAFISGGYGFGFEDEDDRFHADFGVSRSFGNNLNMAFSAGYNGAYDGMSADEISMLFRMNYRPDSKSSLGLSYDPARHRTRMSYSQREGHGVGSWHVDGELSHETAGTDGFDPMTSAYTADGSIHYTGNRGNLALYQQSRLAGLDASALDQRTSLRVETGLAFADGTFAMGRPVSGGFAIVAPHAGLSDNDVTIGKRENGLIAQADMLGPALIPSVTPYSLSRIDYDVDDLPPGYDLGEGLFDLQPRYRSGYLLTVGSAYTVTALGTLRGADGEPIALLTGFAIEAANPDKKVEFFTNRAGRFAAQGLSPGLWIFEVASDPPQRFQLDIAEGAVGLVRAGELALMKEAPQ